jgi:Flp pilus assembly protein TadB
MFSFFIPYLILKELIKNNKNKILNVFPTYLIALKNYTKTDNNILGAFKRVDISFPISIYINRFNISIENGINVFECFEKLKNDININKINDFLTASQYCYLNGGNFSKILEKYCNILTNYNLQKEKEKEESLGSKIVLYILILMNIYILVGFVLTNIEYRNIILGTLFGKIIININLLSYMLIFFFIKKMNNLEE